MFRNLASALILTERDAEFDPNPPKVKGRIITTLQKAKEIRPLVEKCVTIARRSLKHQEQAEAFAPAPNVVRSSGSSGVKAPSGRNGVRPGPRSWRPSVALCNCSGDREAVKVLFEEVAPRFADRDGGYTRVMRLAEATSGRCRHAGDSRVRRPA